MNTVARDSLLVAGRGKSRMKPVAGRKNTRNQRRATSNAILLTLIVLLLAPDAYACSVCYGAPGDPMTEGANNGILFLLGVVGFVQLGFVALFWSFWRRQRALRRFRESLHVIEGGPHS